MAPEQADGREVGPEADLYSLALVLYEALTGVNPQEQTRHRRRTSTFVPPLRRQRRDLSRRLAAGLDQALRPRPYERGSLLDLRATLLQSLDEADDMPGVVAPGWRGGYDETLVEDEPGPEWRERDPQDAPRLRLSGARRVGGRDADFRATGRAGLHSGSFLAPTRRQRRGRRPRRRLAQHPPLASHARYPCGCRPWRGGDRPAAAAGRLAVHGRCARHGCARRRGARGCGTGWWPLVAARAVRRGRFCALDRRFAGDPSRPVLASGPDSASASPRAGGDRCLGCRRGDPAAATPATLPVARADALHRLVGGAGDRGRGCGFALRSILSASCRER